MERLDAPSRGMPGFKTPREQLESDLWEDYIAKPENQYYKINVQQMAKNPVLMDCIVAPDGYRFVQLDFTALEPNVLAEYSECPTYREVYASGKPHDIYFYITCKLLDKDGKISKVYNLENPTPDTVKAAKKQFKKERTIGKIFQLMSTYKAGAKAIWRKLLLMGIDIPFEEVKDNRKRYWGPELFEAVAGYESHLLEERAQRGGWILNGISRPLAITDDKSKDIVNTMIQSSGHDITDMLILYVEQLAKERQITLIPAIPDYHDETIWMVPEEQAEAAALTMSAAVDKINQQLGYSIPLRGDPEITTDFTTFKGPDPISWYEEMKK